MSVDIKDKINKSLICIDNFLKKYPKSYVGLSFGKDSIVLMDLVLKINPENKIVWVDRGEGGDTPDTFEMFEYYISKGINIERIMTDKSIFDILIQNSIEDILQKGLITKNLKQKFKDIQSEYHGFFWGLRAEENKKTRGKYAKFRGEIWENKNKKGICSPVLWWTGKDIWAYIIQNGLRYNNHYDIVKKKDFDREKTRYSNWAGLINIQRGRLWELKRFYPDMFMNLAKIKPEIMHYV